MPSRRPIDPRLLAAFQAAAVAPQEEEPSAGPPSRLDVIRRHLEAQPGPAPDFGAEPDLEAAQQDDATTNFRAGMLAAGQSFLGNRGAVGRVQQTNAAESAALAEKERRRRALQEWAGQQDRQRVAEADLLSRASAAEESARATQEKLSQAQESINIKGRLADAKITGRAGGGAKAEAKKIQQGLKNTSDLRKEFNSLPAVKNFREVSVSFAKAKGAAATPSAAGDMALIFTYMKLLDPNSTVREGEYASAQNAAGTPDRIRAQFNKVVDGEILAPAQRADFIAQAEKLMSAQRAQYDESVGMYSRLAQKSGLSPEDVVGSSPPALPAPTPKGPTTPSESTPPIPPKRTLLRTGTNKKTGKRVVEYSDGTREEM